jgi:para-aminobenzoate synthetase component 1
LLLKHAIFPVTDFRLVKEKVLNWLQRFDTFCFLDNHQYQIGPHTQECLLGAGVRSFVSAGDGPSLNGLQQFLSQKKGGWLFGHLGYDLKNEIESLVSLQPDHVRFPDLYFFEPQVVMRISEKQWYILAEDPEGIFDEVNRIEIAMNKKVVISGRGEIKSRLTKENYIDTIRHLQDHILRGDCYEVNFCQEFYIEETRIDPLAAYTALSNISPNPFSAFYRLNDKWLMCASPERFLHKKEDRIIAQPIKGTSRRIPEDAIRDKHLRDALYHSAKDRSENVMIVDLMRNDLSRVCEEGSVSVEELYGIYSFPQVHQMISTISGILRKDVSFKDILDATFPMGSMTGAPKRRVMELIEQYEQTKRGIFSGALGYIDPSSDFDFNVVIRSILYNEAASYVSFPTGSAITFYSHAEEEWEECLVKAEAMKQIFSPEKPR